MELTAEQRRAAKAQGCLSNRDGESFSVRVITENGVLNHRQMANISEVASLYGNGDVAFTARMTVEIQGIRYEDLGKVQEHLAREGMFTGGTGAKVRPVVSCKGTVCVFGLIDTQAIAKEVHDRFFVGYENVKLPHKFKIAVGGCPNSCVKPDLNDVGIVGQRMVELDEDKCKGCGKCAVEQNCAMKAAKVVDGKLFIDREKCNNCGLCMQRCHFKAFLPGKQGYLIYAGGRWGKQTRRATAIGVVETKDEALNAVEKAILFYREAGQPGERFASTIERVGEQAARQAILTDEIFSRKEAILAN